jgi:hypothetical protein
MTHQLFRKLVMLTRTPIARLAPTARRLLGVNAWKTHAAILLSLAMGTVATADDAVGLVRINDEKPAAAPSVAGAPAAPSAAPAATSPPVEGTAATCDQGGCPPARRGLLGRCCLCNSGCGWRFLDAHCYCMTYAYNPWYTDCRDGRVYAAYGWGAPMTVPLAPTVTNQHNYGWGIPSSRLTPISRVAPHPGALTGVVAPY